MPKIPSFGRRFRGFPRLEDGPGLATGIQGAVAPPGSGAGRERGETMRFPGRHSRAAVLAALVLAAAVGVAPAGYQEGLNYFKSGKYAEAAAEFQAIVDTSPNYDFGFYILGLSFFKMGKLPEARKNLEKAIELNPDKFEYHHGLASVLFAQGKYHDALAILNDAEGLVNAGSRYAFYSLRGNIYATTKKWGETVSDLEKALTVKKSAPILNQLGKAYFALGRNDKAVQAFHQSLRINPNDVEIQGVLARALVNLAKQTREEAKKKSYYTEALRAAQKYRAARPNNYEAVNLVGKAALGAGDYKTAAAAFRKVLEIKPDWCYAMINLAKVYNAQQRWKEAEKSLLQATKCAPRINDGWELLGFVYRKEKRLQDSLAAYKRADQIQSSAATRKAIAEVETNIKIIAENRRIAEEEKKQQAQLEAEQKRLEQERKKREEWKKKTESD